LGFEPAEERIEGAFIDGHAVFGEGFAQRVAVLLGVELGEDGENEGSAAELHSEIFEEVVVFGGHIVCRILCCNHCMLYTVRHTVLASSVFFVLCEIFEFWVVFDGWRGVRVLFSVDYRCLNEGNMRCLKTPGSEGGRYRVVDDGGKVRDWSFDWLSVLRMVTRE
jgi:hypothetical protein